MNTAASDKSFVYASTRSTPCAARLLEVSVVATALALSALILERSYDETATAWIAALAIAALVTWIVGQDLKTFTIADGAIVSIACLAFADRWSAGDTVLAIGLDCILTGGVLLAFREIYYLRRGFDGLGLGDVKLAAAAGLLVGAAAFAWALLAASLMALGFVAARRFASSACHISASLIDSNRLAFGAFLAPVVWVVWATQHAPLLLPFISS